MAAKDIPARLLSKLPFGGNAESETEGERSPSERSSTAPEPAKQSVAATPSSEESAAAREPNEREAAEDDGEAGGTAGRSSSSDSSREVDASKISAPSIGPNTVIEREDAEDRLARHEQSTKDAMGLDKRRSVIGGRYSASVARQATLYGIFLAVIAALVIGALALVNDVDQAPASNPDAAPWAETEREPTPLQ